MKNNKLVITFLFVLMLVAAISIAAYVNRPDGMLSIVACNVGQGDAYYIRFPDGRDGLIDGGPSSRVLECLSEHMAIGDRTIELVFLTHPHADHYRGLISVLNRYEVELVIVPLIGGGSSSLYQQFIEAVESSDAVVQNLYQGDFLDLDVSRQKNSAYDKVVLNVLWPEKQWITEKRSKDEAEEKVLGMHTSLRDLNEVSYTLHVSYGEFDTLLTGDAEAHILEKIQKEGMFDDVSIELLELPHHGSENGLTSELISTIAPQLAIVSAGEGNKHGHPHPTTLELLSERSIPVVRTDIDGAIVVRSDGSSWGVQTRR